jgi:hypothetical protein
MQEARYVSLIPRTTLHSDSEHLLSVRVAHNKLEKCAKRTLHNIEKSHQQTMFARIRDHGDRKISNPIVVR